MVACISMTQRTALVLFVIAAAACIGVVADAVGAGAVDNRFPSYRVSSDEEEFAPVTVPGSGGSVSVASASSPDTQAGRQQAMKVLNAEARIFLYENFLSPEECDEIIRLAEPRLEASVVVDKKSYEVNSTVLSKSGLRTSSGMFLDRAETKAVADIEDRIAAWTLLPSENGEPTQVLRYANGEKYDPHWDYFFHDSGVKNGGNRYATIIAYLSDVEAGGETIFPFFPAPGGQNAGLTECARQHLAVRPKKGDAILFHNIQPSGAFEKRAMHGSCPVVEGTKWALVKWMHVGRYAVGNEAPLPIKQVENPAPVVTGSECMDSNTNCGNWSMNGECYKNHIWMVGSPTRPGHCLQSCVRCDIYNAHLELISQSQAKATIEETGSASGCRDHDARCAKWATEGECINNAVWMVGQTSKVGNCMSSCLRCDVWQANVTATANAAQQAASEQKPKAAEAY